jgi:hypothetical protein
MDAELRARAMRIIWNTPDPRGEDGTVIADNWIDAREPIAAILDALAPIIAEVEAAAYQRGKRDFLDRMTKAALKDARAIRAQKEPSA